MGKTVVIGLGSNLGDRQANIQRAIAMLKQQPTIHILEVSTLIETQPVGPVQDQPAFMNGVLALETTLKPLELLDTLLSVEQRLGRVRKERWGPRIIDLDILLYGDETIRDPRLVVPHPEIGNRPFIGKALDELGYKELSWKK